MYRIATLTTLTIAGIAAVASPALATAPPDTTPTAPPATEAPVGTAATAEIEAAGAQSVDFVDESGSPLAALTVVAVEPAWTGFARGRRAGVGARVSPHHDPRREPQPTRAVRSRRGRLRPPGRRRVRHELRHRPHRRADRGVQEPVEEAELAEGESVELALTFEMVSGVAPQALFFMPDFDRLVTVTDLS